MSHFFCDIIKVEFNIVGSIEQLILTTNLEYPESMPLFGAETRNIKLYFNFNVGRGSTNTAKNWLKENYPHLSDNVIDLVRRPSERLAPEEIGRMLCDSSTALTNSLVNIAENRQAQSIVVTRGNPSRSPQLTEQDYADLQANFARNVADQAGDARRDIRRVEDLY